MPGIMGKRLTVHVRVPQPRLIAQAVETLRAGGVAVYPTDSCYALGCLPGDKAALERICRIRRLDARHNFTLACRDLSEISLYARVSNPSFRLMKGLTPGPYTFILKATHEVPRRLQNVRRKTIGLRVPDNRIAQALLQALGAPLMSTTLRLPDDDLPLTDPDEIEARLGERVDVLVDGGCCGLESTTVIDLADEIPVVARVGCGDVSRIGG